MDDKELLELAAKAAGIPVPKGMDGAVFSDGTLHFSGFGAITGDWNPLTDDGDALRLAVKLCLSMAITDEYVEVYPTLTGLCREFMNDDPPAATRRAIVRAAAEIGGRNA